MSSTLSRRTLNLGAVLGSGLFMVYGAEADETLRADTSAPGRLPPLKGPFRPQDFTTTWWTGDWQKDRFPFKPENVVAARDGTVELHVRDGGSASVIAGLAQPRLSKGVFIMDATIGKTQPGLVYSPLFLYSDAKITKDEVDFEVVGTKGLQLTIHTDAQANAHVKLIPGDWSGRRIFEIRYEAGERAEWWVDGQMLHRVTKTDLPKFPTHPLNAVAEVWVSNSGDGWAGVWTGGDSTMRLHGFKAGPP